ncbi:uncharacterized protein PSFLO_06475 [Pseudozyma flocculosa]|nr:uncharacterized protein PSFLO_06475 [Pseudozyma flocculosa]
MSSRPNAAPVASCSSDTKRKRASASSSSKGRSEEAPKAFVVATYSYDETHKGWMIHLATTPSNPLPSTVALLCDPKTRRTASTAKDRTDGHIATVDRRKKDPTFVSCRVTDFGRVECHYQAAMEGLLSLLSEAIRRFSFSNHLLVDAHLVHFCASAPQHARQPEGISRTGNLADADADTLLMRGDGKVWDEVLAILEFKDDNRPKSGQNATRRPAATSASDSSVQHDGTEALGVSNDASSSGVSESTRSGGQSRSSSNRARAFSENGLSQLMVYARSIIGSNPGFASVYAFLFCRAQCRIYHFSPDHVVQICNAGVDDDPVVLYRAAALLLGLQMDSFSGFVRYRRAVTVSPDKMLYIQLPPEEARSDRQYLAVRIKETPVVTSCHSGILAHRNTQVLKAEVKAEGEDEWQLATIKVSFLTDYDRFTEGRALRRLNAPLETGAAQDASTRQKDEIRRQAYPQLIAHGTLYFSVEESGLGIFGPELHRAATTHAKCWPEDRLGFRVDSANALFTPRTGADRKPAIVITRYRESADISRVPAWELPAVIADAIYTLDTVGRPREIAHGDMSSGNLRYFLDQGPGSVPGEADGGDADEGDQGSAASSDHLGPPIAFIIDLGEAWIDGRQGEGQRERQTQRMAFSGTQLFWPLKVYRNHEAYLNLQLMEDSGIEGVGMQLEASLAPLDANDDIESSLLVLAYELANRLELRHHRTTGVADEGDSEAERWRAMSFAERLRHFGNSTSRVAFVYNTFRDPRPPGTSDELDTDERDDAGKALGRIRRDMMACLMKCGEGGESVAGAVTDIVAILRRLSDELRPYGDLLSPLRLGPVY